MPDDNHSSDGGRMRTEHDNRNDLPTRIGTMIGMKKVAAVMFAVATVITIQPASGKSKMIQFYSGKSLQALCRKSFDGCTDYIVGVYDALAALHDDNRIANDMLSICLPPRAKDGRLMLTVTKYMNDHPKELRSAAASVVTAALVDAFPCSRSD
jgi:Rap1a immunity proteins